MLCCRDFSENNDKEDDDVNSLVVDDKDSAAESTVPCIAISEDLGKISVEVCDSTTMEETKSDLIKSINDYSCLLGNLSDVSEARDLERQLSEEVEKLRGSRAQLVRDVDDLKQESASARTDIYKLSSSIKREFDSTILIRKINTILGLWVTGACAVLAVYSGCQAELAVTLFALAAGLNLLTVPGCKSGFMDIAPDYSGKFSSLKFAPDISGKYLNIPP